MLTVRSSHGRVLRSLPRILSVKQQALLYSTGKQNDISKIRVLDKSVLNVRGPIAEQLDETQVWTKTRGGRKGRPPKNKFRPDKSRVNVVGEKLCDDILSYIGPTLDRHRGCDILDIYPGAGLWSRKLNEYLQPRSHILMEPDAELYRPILEPLLEKPGTTLIPKSGIVWHELESVLTPTHLPHQVPADREGMDRRNDTLLVVANLTFHPKKRFMNFDSVTALLLHQFVEAIRTGHLFQRYGLVRMLIWVRDDDALNFLPRFLQRRRRQAVDNDLMTEWIHQVCCAPPSKDWFARETCINQTSLVRTIQRMEAAGIKMPKDRAPEGFLDTLAAVRAGENFLVPGELPPVFERPYKDVLARLTETAEVEGTELDITEKYTKRRYEWRLISDSKKFTRLHSRYKDLMQILELRRSGTASPEEIKALEDLLHAQVSELSSTTVEEFMTYIHNLHGFNQNPSLLQWDRRLYEPLIAQPDEFFPNVPSCLLDIQPKAPHPLLRQTGPKSDRAGDFMDLLLSGLMVQPVQPLGASLDAISPGATDYIFQRWKNCQDAPNSDFSLARYAEPVPRLMSGRHWEELLELYMEWPFHSGFYELVGRTQDDVGDDSADEWDEWSP